MQNFNQPAKAVLIRELNNDELIALRAIKPEMMNDFESRFVPSILAWVGMLSQKQLDTVSGTIAKHIKLGNIVKGMPVLDTPAVVNGARMRNKLGAGAFRAGFELSNMLVAKQGKCNEGKRHCQLEVERYTSCPIEFIGALCPAWLVNGEAIMMKVENYLDTGRCHVTTDAKGNNVYTISGWTRNDLRIEKVISKANYVALVAASNYFQLNDCNPNGRLQGGWIGERFVFTDYAL